MSESKSSYQQILKSTSLFGGVQVFNMLIAVVRSKFIAVFIGPDGMGIAALLNTTINLVSSFTTLGLETSAVKFLSQYHAEGDFEKLSRTVAVLKKIMWITGISGAVLLLCSAPLLSRIVFGTSAYTVSFLWISVALLLKQLSTCHLAILQGMHRLKILARVNLLGSFFGLIVSIPFYYYLKIASIVPTIIIASASVFIFSYYYSSKIKLEKPIVPAKALYADGKGMIQLGLRMSLAAILTLFCSYMIQLYIGNNGGLSQVGFYNAGFTILNTYVGLVFTAMATDYFPRLSAVITNVSKSAAIVQQQSFTGILIITPIVVVFLAFSKWIVHLLFSENFSTIVPMVSIGILGMLFRVVSFSIGYMVLIKADARLFMTNAFGFNLLYFLLHIGGYYFYGLLGLGVAFTLHYFLHFVLLAILSFYKYNFALDKEFIKNFGICVFLCGWAFAVGFLDNGFVKYLLSGLSIVTAFVFSFVQINKKTDLLAIISRFKNKK